MLWRRERSERGNGAARGRAMSYEVIQGDCLEVMRGMADNSIDAIITDPPYYRVKDEKWDKQWVSQKEFINWVGELCQQWKRLLRPNGSLYVFASPRMAANVEVKIGEFFNVLNSIVWAKGGLPTNRTGGRWQGAEKEKLRSFFPETERIVFAEHYGADNAAKGVAGYDKKCDELRGFVFEPLRKYLDDERIRAGVSSAQIIKYFGDKGWPKYVTARHSFSASQWELPTLENYQRLREALSQLNHGGQYLRREYEDLRREYEDLRRPFVVSADVPYTDVWWFKVVQSYEGKHPCEKPIALMQHIIQTSTKKGQIVLDCFAGSGSTGVACAISERDFIGIELNDYWCNYSRQKIGSSSAQLRL